MKIHKHIVTKIWRYRFCLKFEIAQECASHECEETRTPNSVLPFKYLHSVYLHLELRVDKEC
jgi:hypothetical protein